MPAAQATVRGPESTSATGRQGAYSATSEPWAHTAAPQCHTSQQATAVTLFFSGQLGGPSTTSMKSRPASPTPHPASTAPGAPPTWHPSLHVGTIPATPLVLVTVSAGVHLAGHGAAKCPATPPSACPPGCRNGVCARSRGPERADCLPVWVGCVRSGGGLVQMQGSLCPPFTPLQNPGHTPGRSALRPACPPSHSPSRCSPAPKATRRESCSPDPAFGLEPARRLPEGETGKVLMRSDVGSCALS